MPLSSTLINTKIIFPRRRSRLVRRAELFDRLTAAAELPFTLICAPAGFGKTTLVSEWLRQEIPRRRAAWIGLDAEDTDPVHFLRYMVASLATIEPVLGQRLKPLLNSMIVPSLSAFMTTLLAEAASARRQMTLVLDDYHLCENIEINAALTLLVDRMPEQLRLIMISRRRPQLPLSLWRSRQQLTELVGNDLRFSSDQIDLFLRDTMGLELDFQTHRAFEAHTEGWVAGLQLAALAYQARGNESSADPPVKVMSFGGRHGDIVDYFGGEVLRHLPVEMCSFLRKTSVLDRLCGDLCDAVTGEANGAAMLAQLEQSNMFVVRLDDDREWYRYHHLFAEYLLGELSPKERADLFRRACAWYESRGYSREAMRSALAADDIPSAIRVFREDAEKHLARGEIRTLIEWLDAIPEADVRANIDLMAYKAWLLYVNGQPLVARAYSALSPTDAGHLPSPHRGMFLTFQAYLALNWGTPGDAIPLARSAVAEFGNSKSFFRPYAVSLLGQAQAIVGDTIGAMQTLRTGVELNIEVENDLMALDGLCHLAPLMCARGELRDAITMCESAAEAHLDSGGRPLPIAGMVHVPLGALLYETNDLDGAIHHAMLGLELAQRLGMVYLTFLAQLCLAKIRYARGERDFAQKALAVAGELARQPLNPRRHRLVLTTTAELQLRDGNVLAATRTLEQLSRRGYKTSESEALLKAQVLLAQGRTRTAMYILSKLELSANKDRREGSLVRICVLQALGANAEHKHAEALAKLEIAVSLAATDEYRRPFLDSGDCLVPRLRQVKIAPAFVKSLLSQFSGVGSNCPPNDMLSEHLTKSEMRILGLLSGGLKNQEIADQLGTTVATTKWHLVQIFGKLHVRNRTEAILKASQLVPTSML